MRYWPPPTGVGGRVGGSDGVNLAAGHAEIQLRQKTRHRHHLRLRYAGARLFRRSIILIILGDVLGIAVGDLFKAAVVPGFVLIGAYLIYIFIHTWLKPESAPALPR